MLKEAEQMIYETHALEEAAQLANLPRLDRHHRSPVVSAYLSTYKTHALRDVVNNLPNLGHDQTPPSTHI